MSPTKTSANASARKRRADAERSITSIITAALESLAVDPEVSMAEIARRAGVVRATVYTHFPTRESLLDAVMEYAVGQVAQSASGADPTQGEPEEALARVLRASWHKLSDFHTLLAINTSRLSAKELHRRHQPVMTLFVPLIERGQAKGVFRSDLPVAWHLAMIRAIAHAASTEVRSGRIDESSVEDAMIATVMNAVGPS
jgi:TetR/AcrR family transcriptional regulator, mexCD-oprJ operon repressor